MNDPHEVLGVSPQADSATVRKRYLDLVRKYPPEREPRRAAEIRAAYEAMQDPEARMKREIIEVHPRDSLAVIARKLQQETRSRRIPVEVLLKMAGA